MESYLTLSQIITLATSLFSFGGFVWWMSSQLNTVKADSDNKLAILRAELNDYKVEAARNYASMQMIESMRDSINALTGRIDQMMTLIAKVGNNGH